jgi:serine protease Do
VALVAVAALVGLAPHVGLTKSSKAPLWSEQAPMAQTPLAPAPDWVQIGRRVKPAVVNVSVKQTEAAGPEMAAPFGENSPLDRYFKDFFGSRPRRYHRGVGSGFIINPEGYIVTSHHVVDGASQIRVKLSDGREFQARLVGRDSKTDVALLKIEAQGLPAISLGDSAALQVGEPVMAIGNPFGLEQTVTTGIVSATGRSIGAGPYDDFIQTDASINPGNSGGPLVNARGQAIGINTAIFSQGGGSVGIGFAIPVNLAKSVVAQLAETGHVVRGWLGVTIQPLTAELAKGFDRADTAGVLVSSVSDGSPAAKAGVKAGDIVVEYDGKKIARSGDLPRAVAETAVGRQVPLTVVRDGKPMTLTAKIEAMEPSEPRPAALGDKARPALGIAVQPVTPALAERLGLPEKEGVLVQRVEDASPAAEAGVRPGDVIVEVNRQRVNTVDELKAAVEKRPKGKPVLLMVRRDGASLYLAVAA